MAVLYSYRAKDRNGKVFRGTLEAANEDELYEKLKEDGKYVVYQEEKEISGAGKQMKLKRIADFNRQLGTLVSSGISLVRALKIISEEETNSETERKIFTNVLLLVRQGKTLSEALYEQHGVFPELMIHMIQAAETSGNLDKTALQLAVQYEKTDKLNHKVKSAMIYPKILCGLIVIVVAIIMAYVIPQFQSMFDQMETLPVTTTILLAISNFVRAHWIGILVTAAIVIMGMSLLVRVPAVRLRRDRMLIHMPLIGKQQQIVYTARFARTLSSLYSAGIPIITSLQIVRNTIGNYYIEQQFDEVIFAIRTGGNLSDALEKVDGFTKKMSSSIRIGEETGKLDSMLNNMADSLEYESEVAVSRMVSYLEPTMIVIMAVIIGFIMIAVMQPIYGSYETIGQSTYTN